MKRNSIYLREDVLQTISLRQLQLLTSKRISRLKQFGQQWKSTAYRTFVETKKYERSRQTYIDFLKNPDSLPWEE